MVQDLRHKLLCVGCLVVVAAAGSGGCSGGRGFFSFVVVVVVVDMLLGSAAQSAASNVSRTLIFFLSVGIYMQHTCYSVRTHLENPWVENMSLTFYFLLILFPCIFRYDQEVCGQEQGV